MLGYSTTMGRMVSNTACEPLKSLWPMETRMLRAPLASCADELGRITASRSDHRAV